MVEETACESRYRMGARTVKQFSTLVVKYNSDGTITVKIPPRDRVIEFTVTAEIWTQLKMIEVQE